MTNYPLLSRHAPTTVQRHVGGKCVWPGTEWEAYLKVPIDSLLERLRNEADLRDRFVEFNHHYTAKVRDVDVVRKKLGAPEGWQEGDDVTTRKSIYDLVTPSDEALGLMYYMNMEENWAKRYAKRDDLDDECHDVREGRWTKRGGKSYTPGFEEEALKYFDKAVALFKAVRGDKDLLFKFSCESVAWYDANVHQRRKKKETTKTKKGGSEEEILEAPDIFGEEDGPGMGEGGSDDDADMDGDEMDAPSGDDNEDDPPMPPLGRGPVPLNTEEV